MIETLKVIIIESGYTAVGVLLGIVWMSICYVTAKGLIYIWVGRNK